MSDSIRGLAQYGAGVPGVQTEGAPRGDYININAPANAFGALNARTAQQFGSEAQQGSGQLEQAAETVQTRQNQTAVDQAYNNYSTQTMNIMYGDPNAAEGTPERGGLISMRGADALNAGPGMLRRLSDARNQMSSQLQNGAQKLLFDEQSRRLLTATQEQVGRHLDAQQQAWSQEVNRSALDTQARSAALTYNDDDHIMHTLADTNATGIKAFTSQYGGDPNGPEARQAGVDAQGQVVHAAIEGAAAHGDWATAQHLFDKFGAVLAPNVAQSIGQELHAKARKAGNDAYLDNLLGGQIGNSGLNGAARPNTAHHVSGDLVVADQPSGQPIEDEAVGRASKIISGLMSRGIDQVTATAFAANALHESAANPNTGAGDMGASHGAFQWRGQRADNLQKFAGQLDNAPLDKQLDFLVNELHGDEAGAWTAIQSANGLAAKTAAVSKYYERPNDINGEQARRGATALQLASQIGLPGALQAVPGTGGATAPAAGGASPAQQAPSQPKYVAGTGTPEGLVTPGNLDLNARPTVHNADGSISTVRSITIEAGGKGVLIPTVVGGKVVSDDEAVAHYKATGENLGTFDTEAHADAYAQSLHEEQAAQYVPASASGQQPQAQPIPTTATPQAQQQAPADQFPDESALTLQVLRDTRGDPEQREALLSGLKQRMSIIRMATETDRTNLTKSLPNIEAALSDGKDGVQIPEAQIRHLLPPAQAASVMEELNTAQSAGQAFKAVAWGTPDDIVAARQRLTAGMGAASTQPKAGNVGGQGEEAPGEDTGTEAYRLRQKVLAKFDEKVAARNEALTKDPAAFAGTAPPVVAAAKQLDPNNPQTISNYFNALSAVQTHLGIPEGNQHLLSLNQAQAKAAQLSSADPSTTDIGKMLDKMSTDYGDNWGKVFGDMVTLGKLNPQYQTLAMIGDKTVRNDFQRMLATAQEKGGTSKLREAASDQAKTDVKQATDAALVDFNKTVMVPGIASNVDTIGRMKSAISDLALFYTLQGQDGATAVKNATSGILGRYDFDGTKRIPKGTGALVDAATSNVLANLKPEDLAPPLGAYDIRQQPAATQESPEASTAGKDAATKQAQEDWLATAKNKPTWVTNESDNGLVLFAQTKDGRQFAVRKADGSRVEVPFANLEKQATPPPAPGTVLGVAPSDVTIFGSTL